MPALPPPALRRFRALVAGLLLGTALVAAPAGAPAPAAAIGPLPDCRLDDILTNPRGYDDWPITLVDWILTLGPDYKPPDLVSVREGGVGGGGLIREVVIPDLKAMAAAAKKNGTPLVAWSPYRGYAQQEKLFNGYAGWNPKTKKYSNYDSAITFSARPGHSEHQTGLTIDFVAVGDDGLTSNWEVTKTGAWMAKHAWEYGWLMSYPKGKKDVVCYSYEPWHYRYVGRELAAKIHESGLTIREYLWANYTLVDPTTGQPLPSATPVPTPSPTPAVTEPPTSTSAPPTQVAVAPAASGESSAPPASTTKTGALLGLPPPIAAGLLLILLAVGAIAFGIRRRSRRV